MARIECEKCILREWRPEDAASLAKYADNFEIWRYMRDGFPHPYTEADAQTFISMAIHSSGIGYFAIEVDGEAVGGMGFIPLRDVERVSGEVGYWLGEPFWGKGIVADAMKGMVEYIFTHTKLLHLFAKVYSTNPASMRVLEKAGFEKRAILRKAAIKNKQVIDLHYYERVKE